MGCKIKITFSNFFLEIVSVTSERYKNMLTQFYFAWCRLLQQDHISEQDGATTDHALCAGDVLSIELSENEIGRGGPAA